MCACTSMIPKMSSSDTCRRRRVIRRRRRHARVARAPAAAAPCPAVRRRHLQEMAVPLVALVRRGAHGIEFNVLVKVLDHLGEYVGVAAAVCERDGLGAVVADIVEAVCRLRDHQGGGWGRLCAYMACLAWAIPSSTRFPLIPQT